LSRDKTASGAALPKLIARPWTGWRQPAAGEAAMRNPNGTVRRRWLALCTTSGARGVLDATASALHRFNRYETKYLMAESRLAELHALLGVRMAKDAYQTQATRVTSLYYDTPDLRFYWEKIDGLRFRRKLRIRKQGHEPAAHRHGRRPATNSWCGRATAGQQWGCPRTPLASPSSAGSIRLAGAGARRIAGRGRARHGHGEHSERALPGEESVCR